MAHGSGLTAAALLAIAVAQSGAPPTGRGGAGELAGRSIDGYPHFRFVRDFRDVDAVAVAVDPHRFPEVAGRTCDLWIVDAGSAGGSGPLVDARGGGPQVVTIDPASVRFNIFVAAAPGALDSDAGAGLGVGYDVVLDCDRDGRAGPGDLVDGRNDAPGFWRVRATTLAGPLAVETADVQVGFGGSPTSRQRIWWPAGIESLGPLPLVVVSHGWTHLYTWYDHIGLHLASYGYVVMSHTNDVGFGDAFATRTASAATLAHVEGFLGSLDTLAGGVLAGRVDARRIALVGHSTGGEGIVHAWTRLHRREARPAGFDAGDVRLLVAIAPTSWLPGTEVDPSVANLHMFLGGADTDTSGAPFDTYTQPAAIFERSTGNRHLTYVHGAGHGDFHAGPGNPWAAGPSLIGREETNRIVQGYMLPLVELYLEDNPAARDYVERAYEDFHPAGIAGHVTISVEHREALSRGHLVLDDHQSHPSVALSSSGGAIATDVEHLEEIAMRDLDGSLAWTPDQPANGMTRARFDDDPRAVVFDWSNEPRYYELALPDGERDLTDDTHLSFRVCQGTRHPETVALDGPLSFVVALVDGAGRVSSIDFAPYGRATALYPRPGLGPGAGWQNEFTTVRIPLTDFLADGAELDLRDVAAVRFEFGPGRGAPRGRIGLDDVEILRRSIPPQRPSPPNRLVRAARSR